MGANGNKKAEGAKQRKRPVYMEDFLWEFCGAQYSGSASGFVRGQVYRAWQNANGGKNAPEKAEAAK